MENDSQADRSGFDSSSGTDEGAPSGAPIFFNWESLRDPLTANPTTLVILDKICKSYDGERHAVDQVSFSVERGELVVLLGESGCGKTTLLKMINRLIEPTSGRIEVNGQDVQESRAVELRRSIGYVFQGIGLFPHMTVAENVGITPTLLGWPKEKIARCVDELLDLVHLPPSDYRQRTPDELSGGQQQRVGFARALAARPSLMLLDEPFGALDPVTRDRLQLEFAEIHRKFELTVVMVTHDVGEALLMADRIIVMRDGRILRSGTPGELLSDPQDSYVSELMATPRRHIEILESLIDRDKNPNLPSP